MEERAELPQVASDEPAVYRIRVLGLLGDDWRDLFDGFQMHICDKSPQSTVLTGLLADQAALMGVLAHLYASGVTVLAVERVAPQGGAAADTAGAE